MFAALVLISAAGIAIYLVLSLLSYLLLRRWQPELTARLRGPLERLADGLSLEFIECTPVGPDLRIRARLPGRAHLLEERLTNRFEIRDVGHQGFAPSAFQVPQLSGRSWP